MTDPMAVLFPTDSVCDLRFQSNGEMDNHKIRCSVPLNYHYAYYFSIIWWYFVTVAFMYVCMALFWICLKANPLLRAPFLNLTTVIGTGDYENLRKICLKITIAEFFILQQILFKNSLEFNSEFIITLFEELYPNDV